MSCPYELCSVYNLTGTLQKMLVFEAATRLST